MYPFFVDMLRIKNVPVLLYKQQNGDNIRHTNPKNAFYLWSTEYAYSTRSRHLLEYPHSLSYHAMSLTK